MEIKKLAEEGQIFTHQKEKNILTGLHLQELLREGYESVGIDQKLSALVEMIKKSDRNTFAVHDGKGKFAGIIELNDIKQHLFQQGSYETVTVSSIMKKPAAVLYIDQDMHMVMEKFDITQSWYLPVINRDNVFLGFVSKTKLFNKYRESLASHGDLYDQ